MCTCRAPGWNPHFNLVACVGSLSPHSPMQKVLVLHIPVLMTVPSARVVVGYA